MNCSDPKSTTTTYTSDLIRKLRDTATRGASRTELDQLLRHAADEIEHLESVRAFARLRIDELQSSLARAEVRS